MTVIPLTGNAQLDWNNRFWAPMTEAVEPEEMFAYLRASHFRFDYQLARDFATGGTFDVRWFGRSEGSNPLCGTFRTYTVVDAGNGLFRLYRATDIRELRDGQTW
jgi:hypothetical protein